MQTAFTNATIYTGHGREQGKAILVGDGLIEAVVEENAIDEGYTISDLGGLNIAPALIDLQIYGGNGKMFSSELSLETLSSVYQYCLEGGCAHFMITMATNTMEKFLKGMEVVKEYWKRGGKGVLGLHMEGPYLNPEKEGRSYTILPQETDSGGSENVA